MATATATAATMASRDAGGRGRSRSAGSPGLTGVSTEAILESISDGVFTVDRSWRITSFNRAAEEITGITRSDALGQRCADVFRASMCEGDCALRRTLETGEPVVGRAAFIVDADGRRIPISLSTALLRDDRGEVVGGAETFRDLTLIEELRREISGRAQVGDIISRSSAMQRVLDLLPRVADSDAAVLLRGETGTGKELVARAIHELSPRSDGPFIAVNSGALPDSLLESELFGYQAGAFTGAVRNKPGRFALADGGTLFLDEIGEISPALQVRLLRVLQEKTFEPLGATRSRHVDVRVIAATNRDLVQMMSRGEFRQDLYYRIKVVELELPPLRERREDIPLLVDHFVDRLDAIRTKQLDGVSRDVLAVLMAHDYPGNVRELQNILEHAAILCPGGAISLEHLPAEIVPPRLRAGNHRLCDAVRAVEVEAILAALERNHCNRSAAAQELGLHKSTLFRKAKSLGIRLPDEDGRSHRATASRSSEDPNSDG